MRVGAKAGTVWLGLLLCAMVGMALFAAPASAQKTRLFLETFGSVEQPEFQGAATLTLDPSSGDLLVASNVGGFGFDKGVVSRFHADGTPAPFSALGTNVIDSRKGPGGKACAEEPSSCDLTPRNGFDFGAYPGQQDIALDDSGTLTDGNIYVTNFDHFGQQNLTSYSDNVVVFASDGHYLGQLDAAGGTGLKDICGVAVDPGGNVYLAEWRPSVEIEPGVSKSPEGRIYKFDPSANPPLSTDHVATLTTPEVVCNPVAGAGPSAGALFAFGSASSQIFKLDAASGALQSVVVSNSKGLLSVDPVSGHLFTDSGVDQGGSSLGREFNVAGGSSTLLSSFPAFTGVAGNGAIDRVYSSSGSEVRILGPIVTVPDVVTGSYEITGDTSVRVKGTVNPDGQALTECFFEYDTERYFPNQAAGKEGEAAHGQTAPCAPNAVEIGSGTAPVEVHADLSGLDGEAAYHYRLVARNANAALYPKDPRGAATGANQTFKTPSKPAIKGVWAANVIVTEATLKATVNPENATTTYRFEWGLDSSYGESTAEISLGAGDADHTVGLNLTSLEPATTYHYRLVATNAIGVTEAADHRFTTFAVPAPSAGECENEASRGGFGALLPDCRAYEMVSPVDKDGGDIRPLLTSVGELAVIEQSSTSGEKLTYGSYRAFGDTAGAPYSSQYVAQRIEGQEWQTHSVNPPRERAVYTVLSQFRSEFQAFSADLCDAWLVNFADPPLGEGAVAGYSNLYRRTDELCGEGGEASYQALAPVVEPENLPGTGFFERLGGVSADAGVAVFTANDKLTPEAAAEKRQAYVSTESGPHLVCVLPSGAALKGPCQEGASIEPVAGAEVISSDGSRVFWSTPGAGLYLRENPEAPESARLHGSATGKGDLIGPASGTGNLFAGSELVKNVKPTSGAFAVGQEISSANEGIPAKTTIVKIEETSAGVFTLTLSAKVIAGKTKAGDTLTGAASATVPGIVTETGAFQAGQEISAPAIPPGTTVLSCSPSCGPGRRSLTLSAKATKAQAGAALSATSPCTEAATKACTIPVSEAAEEEAGAKNPFFWGAAEDGSQAIFTTQASGNSDGNNLYSFEPDGEVTTLIAEGVYVVMGISDDASRIYFASSKVLDAGATAGQPNLYLYEAGEGGGTFAYVATVANNIGDLGGIGSRYSGTTARVTPDAAHAAFISVAPLTEYDNKAAGNGTATPQVYRYDAEADELLCVSCNPSGARPTDGASIPQFLTPLQGAGALTDDGSRLYFQSADALTPRDSNGKIDVYQWEAPGAGTCEESLPTYSSQNGGCVELISSGQSHLRSRFVDASPSGDDVFISTASGFLPQDPGGVDIYDARVNGGLPIPQGRPPGCEGEACQGVVEAPNDPTPSSLTFEGAGNVREEATPTRRPPCAKGKVRRKGKCVARHHKRAKQRAKRHRRVGR